MARMRPVAPTRRLYEFPHLTNIWRRTASFLPALNNSCRRKPRIASSRKKSWKKKKQRQLNTAVHAGAVAQVVIAAGVILAICYVAKLVLITLLVSILLAFVLEPVVNLLENVRLPRSAGAFLAVLLMLALMYAGSYFLYGKAMSFVHELPKYSDRIRSHLAHFRQQTSELEKTTQQVFPEDKNARKPMPVKVENQGGQGMVSEKLARSLKLCSRCASFLFSRISC